MLKKDLRKTKNITFGIDTTRSFHLLQKDVTEILLSIDKTYYINSYKVSISLLTVNVVKRTIENQKLKFIVISL